MRPPETAAAGAGKRTARATSWARSARCGFPASLLALGVTACLKLRDVPLFVQRHSLSPNRHETSMRMGYPHNYGLKPSARKRMPS
jgi:hypothetical protein